MQIRFEEKRRKKKIGIGIGGICMSKNSNAKVSRLATAYANPSFVPTRG